MKKILLLLTSTVFIASTQAQVANTSLETWRNYSAGIPPTTNLEAPTDWFGVDSIIYTFAPLASATPQKVLFKDASAHTGSFAAKMVSKDLSGFVAPGVLVNANPQLDFGSFDPSNPLASLAYQGGTSVSQRYNSVIAWVKYTPANNDVGVASIQAIKTGAGAGGADSVIGEGALFLATTATYTEIIVPITYTDASTIPDKMLITFLSSDLSGENSTTPQDGSTLYVDDVSLSMATSIKDIFKEANLGKIYPNPTDNILNIAAENTNELAVKVYNANGALISQSIFKTVLSLSVNSFASGQYFYEIKDLKDKKVQRGSFSVSH